MEDFTKKWNEYWENNKVYTFNPDSGKPYFSIDTPPPTVSGKMHMGHAFMYSQMDFIARYKRMAGFEVFYPFGTDDNGLPTQILIEKTKKVRASALGRPKFTELCKNTLSQELRPKYVQDWKRIGMSCDWNLFYTTINDHSQKISQQSFIDLCKSGRAYRKKAPIMICPKCKTAIAQVELEDLEQSSTLNYIKARLDNGEYIIFATTRPEVIYANVGISLHEEGDYVKAKKGNEVWILSKQSCDKFSEDWNLTQISEPFKGKNLVGKVVEIPLIDRKQKLTHDDVTRTDYGTGFVYYCTYGGVDCIEWLQRHPDTKKIEVMDTNGTYNNKCPLIESLTSKQARPIILAELEKLGSLVFKEPIKNVVNTHERCGSEIEYVQATQWFIKILDLKEKLLELGKKLNWHPHHMKNRYDNWTNGLRWDWNISRQIFFGVPFPVWYCEKCSEPILAKELPVDPTSSPAPVDKCPKCSHTKFVPENDIINTWATSSLTPNLAIELLANNETKSKLYPMDVRPQGHDIISFWLFNTVVKAHLHYNSLPWKNCMITGWALDPKGKKMSKSRGNVIEPQVMMQKYSADALRFWAASSRLGDDIPFKEKELVAGDKLVKKLLNAAKFCFMHIEGHEPKKPDNLYPFDKWLLSKLNRIILDSTQSFDNFEYNKTKHEVEKFFWHSFCANYLEIVKGRLSNDGEGRESAMYTLYTSLLTIVKLLAPIMPYVTEEVYAKFGLGASVHKSAWPKFDKTLVNSEIESLGDEAIEVISRVRKYKSQNKLSLKSPIKSLCANANLNAFASDIKSVTHTDSLNFKEKDNKDEELKIIIS